MTMKLLIVDHHPITRKGLESLFLGSSKIQVVGSLSDVKGALEFLKKNPVDIILMEIDVPEQNGLGVLCEAKHNFSDIRVLVLSSLPEAVYAMRVIKSGAHGFLQKTASTNAIKEAVYKVSKGDISLSAELTKQHLLSGKHPKDKGVYKKLSARETEVLKLLTKGNKNKDISKALNINEKTVSTYKSRLMQKLKAHNIVDLINRTKFFEDSL